MGPLFHRLWNLPAFMLTIVLVFLAGLGVPLYLIADRNVTKSLEDQISDRLRETTLRMHYLDGVIDTSISHLGVIASFKDIKPSQPETIAACLSDDTLKESGLWAIAAVDTLGKITYTYPSDIAMVQPLVQGIWLEKSLSSNTPQVSDFPVRGPDGQMLLGISSPVKSEDREMIGALVGFLDISHVSYEVGLFNDLYSATSYGALLALDGTIIASSRADRVGKRSHLANLIDLANLRKPLVETLSSERQPSGKEVAAIVPLSKASLVLAIDQDADEFFAPLHALQRGFILIGAILVVLGILAGVAITRFLIWPLRELTEAAALVASGNYSSKPPVGGMKEISKLGIAFEDMRQKIQRRTGELTALNAVATAAGQSLDLNSVLKQVLQQVTQTLHFRTKGGIFLIDAENQELVLTAHQGVSQDFIQEEHRVKIGECLCGLVAQTGEILLSGNSTFDDRHTRWKASGSHSHIIVPLKAGDKIEGVMFLYPQLDYLPKFEDLQLFASIGRIVGVSLANIRLFQGAEAAARQWNTTFDAITDAVSVLSVDFRILRANSTFSRIVGIPLNELKGQYCYKVMHGLGEPIENCPLACCKAEKHATELLRQEPHLGNRLLYIRCDPIPGPDGQVVGAVHIVRDVTKQKLAEKELAESQQKYRTMVETANDFIWSLDTEGKFTFINKKAEEATGYRAEDWLGKSFAPLIYPPEDMPRLQKIFLETISGKKNSYEVGVVKATGGVLNLSVSTAPLYRQGQIVGTVSFGQDITERKKAEKELQKAHDELEIRVKERTSELISINALLEEEITEHEWAESLLRETKQLLEKTFALMGGGIFVIRAADGEIITCNKWAENIFGYSRGEMVGRIADFLHVDRQTFMDFRASVYPALDRNGIFQTEYRMRRKDGSVFPTENVVTGIPDETGRLTSVVAIVRDITERKRAEELIKETKQLLEKTFSALDDAIFVVQPDDRVILACNKGAERVFGYSQDEMIGRNTEFLHVNKKSYEEIGIGLFSSLEKNGRFQAVYTMRRKDGSIFPTEHSVTEIVNESGHRTGIVSVIQDITEYKQAEEDILAAKTRLQYLLASSPVVIYSCKPYGDYSTTFISENIKALTGFEPQKFIDEPNLWTDHIHPDDKQRALDSLSRTVEKGRFSEEYRFQHKDGSYRWMYDEITVVRDAQDRPVELVGYWQDITQRKKAEMAAEEFRNSLVSVVSHEFRTPLTHIKGFATSLLRTDVGWDISTQREFLEGIDQETNRLTNLVSNMLDLSRLEAGHHIFSTPTRCDVLLLAQQANKRSAPFTSQHPVFISLPEEKRFVLADIDQLERVLVNLLENAGKYSNPGQPIFLEVKYRTDGVEFHVRDEGRGIDINEQSKLFKKFSRAHSVAGVRGAGLGLSVCKAFVELNGGKIWLYNSSPGKGSDFAFWIPFVNDKQQTER